MPYTAETSLIKLNPQHPDIHAMTLAGQVIREDRLVAFPTETVYGLGANALSAEAVAKIFAAKERPANDPLIVHIHEIDQLATIAVDIPLIAYTLANTFWAGALTLVLKKHEAIPDNVTAGQNTVAVRMPDHPIALELIREAGVPIAAPSANRFSRPSPTTAQHVLDDLAGRVDVILDGGSTVIGVESTIVDLTAPVPMILRPGGVTLEALRDYLPTVAYRPRLLAEDEIAPSPGTLLKHYSPNAQVIVFAGESAAVYQSMRDTAAQYQLEGESVGIMTLDAEAAIFQGVAAEIVLLGADIEAMATNLFAGMRELDAADCAVMLVRAPDQTGIGLALYDRLLRAAEGNIVTVGED